MFFSPKSFGALFLLCATAIASPAAPLSMSKRASDFTQPNICAEGQIAIGQETAEYSGTFAVIWEHTCQGLDFTSAYVSSMCGRYAYGAEVQCEGSTVMSADVSLTGTEDGTQLTTFGTCAPAPAGSNCNDSFGLTLNTTVSWCCSQS